MKYMATINRSRNIVVARMTVKFRNFAETSINVMCLYIIWLR